MDITVRQTDRLEPEDSGTMPLVLVLDHLRSAYNVGNLFRIAEATRVSRIIACGYTAAPPHEKLAKTARGCDELVPCSVVERTEDAIVSLKAEGYRIYGVETVEGAKAYWDTKFVFPSVLVLGNEALGICKGALALCDEFVCLPALGRKNSINVGNCGAVVVFECLRQLLAGRRSLEDGHESL